MTTIKKIRAEIERRRNKWLDESRLVKKGKDKSMYAAGKSSAYTEFLPFLDTLEAEEKEVDFEREIEVKEDAGGYPYIDIHIELYDYDTDTPLAKKGDKVIVQVRKK